MAAPFTVSDLRAAVAADDLGRVKAGLNEEQEAYLAGTKSADDIRDLFIAQSRSHPQMINFVERWANSDPENPKALSAWARSLYGHASSIQRARNAYSNEVASRMDIEFARLANVAYLAGPDLIPASDAIVRSLGNVSYDSPNPDDALVEVLRERPNWGAIHRSTVIMGHLYGKLTRNSCAYVATIFPKAKMAKMNAAA